MPNGIAIASAENGASPLSASVARPAARYQTPTANIPRGSERLDIDRERALLAVAERVRGKKSRGAVAAQVRHDHPETGRGQDRGDIDKGVNVVGPAV